MGSRVLEIPLIREEEASAEKRFCNQPELDRWSHAKGRGRVYCDENPVKDANRCNTV